MRDTNTYRWVGPEERARTTYTLPTRGPKTGPEPQRKWRVVSAEYQTSVRPVWTTTKRCVIHKVWPDRRETKEGEIRDGNGVERGKVRRSERWSGRRKEDIDNVASASSRSILPLGTRTGDFLGSWSKEELRVRAYISVSRNISWAVSLCRRSAAHEE